MASYTVRFTEIGRDDVGRVGGKNASLGEMIGALAQKGVAVPGGFATTADAFRAFVQHNGIGRVIEEMLAAKDKGKKTLAEAGRAIRSAFLDGEWPDRLAEEIGAAYEALCREAETEDLKVAVRSSATAEDLPTASFAGQQESFLNISGQSALLERCRRCYASLYTDRAIAYREAQGFEHGAVALSVGVQRMVRADTGGAGVMFSIDPDSGFGEVVRIDAAWGLGETVVQGAVEPDAYQVFKPLLDKKGAIPIIERSRGAKAVKTVHAEGGQGTRDLPTSQEERARFVLGDEEVLTLARWACEIERHYGCPMDMEWARDGRGGPLFIVQARPETVRSREDRGRFRQYRIGEHGEALCRGPAIGTGAVSGAVCLIDSAADIDRFESGSILVTGNTDPDWVPIMKQAAAIVTDHGGRTSHAAIVARELGVPAVVGAGNATYRLHHGQTVTVSCAEGDHGTVYDGKAEIETEEVRLDALPATRTKVMLNLASPASALRWWQLPADGVGLARMEFVIANEVKAHPMALLHPEKVSAEAREEIGALTRGYESGADYFVDTLSRGLARIVAAAWPGTAIVRMSDFKTNEYASLLGGEAFEPHEENPMIGFRGASRYASGLYKEGFALECRAIRRLREKIGLSNVTVMIPFCRTPEEADAVIAIMAENGLKRSADLPLYVMCELPSNVVLAEEFAKRFDGFSIGSNDLTQLTLGVDRDSGLLAHLFDERHPAVRWMVAEAIRGAHAAGAKIGLCGQGPSDHPEIAQFLVESGIDTISVTPDSFVAVKRTVAEAEAALGKSGA